MKRLALFFVSVGTVDDDDQTAYERVLKVLAELHTSWREYQIQLGTEISEYKKTVNSALSILGMEAVKFQKDTKERLETDAAERTARQRQVDSEAERRETDAKQRHAADTLATAAFQKKAGWQRGGLAIGMGCLLIINLSALIALAIVLIVMNWK